MVLKPSVSRSWPRFVGLVIAGSALLVGCKSYTDRMTPVNRAFAAGDYELADKLLEQLKKDDASNRHVYELNQGINDLARGDEKKSLEHLRFGRDRMDELTSPNYASWFGAVLTDDTALDYAGEDYEKILVRAMLALANLMGDGRDADAFAHQVLQKQLEIMETFQDDQGNNPKKAYKLVAFGSYLRGLINEENPMNIGVAEREYKRVTELAPHFEYVKADLDRVQNGKFSEKGNGVVCVLALVGLGPFKVEREEPVSSRVLGLAQLAWNIYRDRISFPNLTAVKIPAMAVYRDNPSEAIVEVDGKPAGRTATVTDVNATAIEQFNTMKDWITARAVLRRVFKLTVIEAAKGVATNSKGRYSDAASLGIDILGIIWTSTENADTRCWCMLPAFLQAVRIEVPEGEHDLTVYAGLGGRKAGPPQTVRIRVRDGFNTYVVALVPTLQGGPPPLTSDAPEPPFEAPEPAVQP